MLWALIPEPLAPMQSKRPVAGTSRRFSRRDAWTIPLVGLLYVVCGKLGLEMAFLNASASPVWPPTGIALAAFLLLGNRVWPAILVGAFVVNSTTQGTLATSFGIAVGNTLEGLVGAHLVRRYVADGGAFSTPKNVVLFALLAGLASTVVSATLGVATLTLAGFVSLESAAAVWMTWWLGDVGGALIVAPFLLSWAHHLRARNNRLLGRGPEAAGLLAATVTLSYVVFLGALPASWGPAPFLILILPVIVWASFRFEQVGATTLTLGFSGVAIVATLAGRGPFMAGSANESLLLLQTFMATIATTSLVLAAVVRQRRASHEELRLAHDTLDASVKERTRQLQTAVDEMQAFSYAVSHDLRGPLAVIQSYADLIAARPAAELPAEVRTDLEQIRQETKRLSNLLDALMRLSKLSQSPMKDEAVDLSAEAASIATNLQSSEPKRRVRFIVEPDLVARGDPTMLRLLLNNLLSNAWKFTSRSPDAVIVVRKERVADRQAFVVEDNGVGFPPEQASRLFRIFSRLHPESEYPGTGIGLVTCRRIVERHGGRLWAAPRVPSGAAFFFELPGATTAAPD